MNINTAEYWNKTYSEEEEWRDYITTNDFILNRIQKHSYIREIGCGTGILGKQISQIANYVGYDISEVAVEKARQKGVNAFVFDIMKDDLKGSDYIIACEFLEHFTDEELKLILPKFSKSDVAIFGVPDDCLGNDVCKEHYQKWNEYSFKEFLLQYYEDVFITKIIDQFTGFFTPVLIAECRGFKQ